MLKLKLDTLEGVDENLHDFYEKTDDGYQLKVDGLEDTGALKRAKDREKQAAKEAKERAEQLESDLKEIRKEMEASKHKGAKESGDIEALEKSWQEKLSKREQELMGEIDALKGSVTTMTVDNVAMQLASELAVEGSAKVLLPHIKSRLAVEQRDGQYVTAVRDSEGKPSAMTVDELKAEFASDKAFSHVVAGSKASGAGGSGGGNGGGAAQKGNWTGTKAEQVAAIKSKFPELA